MKTILSILSMLFFAGFICAQTTNKDDQSMLVKGINSDAKLEMKSVSTKMLKEKHNACFVEQISKFISENIYYPEELIEYKVEGVVVVKLTIDEVGEIKTYEIVEGLHDKIDSVVISQMKNFSKLDLEENRYLGNHSVNVPVSFSFDH